MSKTLRTTRHIALVDALVAYRIRGGLTQGDLAERLGRARSIVGAMESGGRRIDLIELIELSEILDFKIQDLVDRVIAAG